MTYRTTRITAAASAALALVPAAAQAHVTLQPKTVPAGEFVRMDVRVPNERDDAGTKQVSVQLPAGFAFASTESAPGWEVEVQRGKAAEPLELHGETYDEQVNRITWTAKDDDAVIAPGEFRDFGVSVRVPEGQDTLTFKALQTYEGGEVVRWIGAEDSEKPAAVVAVTKPGATTTASTAPVAAAPAASVAADGGSDGLAIAGLVTGVLGLLAGGAALLLARRRPTA